MKYYDVTIPITHKMTVYPGDLDVVYERTHTIEKDGYNWSHICSGTHIGTHIDAPVHFVKGGKTLDDFPFELMAGEVTVVETPTEMVTRDVLEEIDLSFSTRAVYPEQRRGARSKTKMFARSKTKMFARSKTKMFARSKTNVWKAVFFKTGNQKLWKKKEFDPDFVSLTPDAAEYLVEKKTKLVGIDYRSIETHYTHDYPVHKILLKNEIFIIEGLYLNDVPAGRYKLYCFPLKLAKGDGGPARVVLAL